jgi:hypothetical protein
MPNAIRPFRRFPVQCSVTYNLWPFQRQDAVWNVSRTRDDSSEICPCVQGNPSP